MSRWQRERRQQGIVVTIFTAVLLFVLGLVAWAASERYYDENLTPAASVQGKILPRRDFERQLQFELVRFYQEFGVPPGFENDPNLLSEKSRYETTALERIIEKRVLELEARAAGYAPTPEEIDRQYEIEFGEFKVRHILISVPQDAEDKELAELNALAKARAVTAELRVDPMGQDTWNRVAGTYSEDPGSKFSGGELGFAGSGAYVVEFENAIRRLALGEISEPVKTQFGFHIIQVMEKRAPQDTDVVKRYLASGYTEQDLKEHARYRRYVSEFERRQKEAAVASPAEQVKIAKIVVNIPLPTSQSFDQFTEALQKQTDVRTALEKGEDFAEVAKKYSDDAETKEKGGEVGWIARGMTIDPTAEERIFATEAGKHAEPVSLGQVWTVYKVLERDPARELEAKQKETIQSNAYPYWLQRKKVSYGVVKHILGNF